MTPHIDSLHTILATRRSVRGFRPDPVPSEVLDRVFSMAALAPSNCNVQPWVVHVVSGTAAETMRETLYAAARSGAPPAPDFPLTGAYPGEYRSRQIEAAKSPFAHLSTPPPYSTNRRCDRHSGKPNAAESSRQDP